MALAVDVDCMVKFSSIRMKNIVHDFISIEESEQRTMSDVVKLSQCMIVKIEEKNIEKALSWGKGIVCEQIVVDTGSTDRTVEIAERMGLTPAALSYHLKLLRSADLVIEYKQKNFIYYEINISVFEELILWVKQFGGNEE